MDVKAKFENHFAQVTDPVPLSTHGLEKLKNTPVNARCHYRDIKPSNKATVTREYLKRLEELQSNKEIILSRPNKGAGIIILNKTDYIERMKYVLGDLSKFMFNTTKKDKTTQIE